MLIGLSLPTELAPTLARPRVIRYIFWGSGRPYGSKPPERAEGVINIAFVYGGLPARTLCCGTGH
jgi:hypothetical protein